MKFQLEVLEIGIKSKRNTRIPATFTLPKDRESFPLVLTAHGGQSSRREYGVYVELSKRLAELGIAVLCFDFPGHNDSEETMLAYTLANNLDDMEYALSYVLENWRIESGKIGLLGWSMGGCMASLFSQRHPEIPALALWAPAICTMDIIQSSGENYVKAFETAVKGGSCEVTKDWCSCDLNGEFMMEVLCSNPYAALNQYQGALFVALGLKDCVLNPSHIQLGVLGAVHAKDVKTCYFEEGDHDFGSAYGKGAGNPLITEKLLEETTGFFVSVFVE